MSSSNASGAHPHALAGGRPSPAARHSSLVTRSFSVLIAAIALLLLAAPAGAQGDVTVQVDAGLDGYYSYISPTTPVRIQLTNRGPSFQARVELDAQHSGGKVLYYAMVDLPQNSSKTVWMYPAYTAFTAGTSVRVLDGRTQVATATDKLTQVDASTQLYGVLAPDLTGYTTLTANPSDHVAVALLTPDTLPARADALGGLNTLVIDGVDTSSLGADQRAAIASWARLGGNLIVAGGPNASQSASGLGDLLPVTLGSDQNAQDLTALTKFAGVSNTPSGGVIATATPKAGANILVKSSQGPLIVTSPVGRGRVVWLAWSPAATPFAAWAGTPAILKQLASDGTALQPPIADTSMISQFIQNVAGIQLPPTLLVAAFLLLYALVLGPGLYSVLKRWDKREWAWLLVPALTVLFALVAYGATFLIRGTGTVVRALDVVQTTAAGGPAQVTTYFGLFSPSRRGYDIAMPASWVLLDEPSENGPAFGPNGPGPNMNPSGQRLYTVEVGDDLVIRDVPVDVYAFKSWAAEHLETNVQNPVTAQLSGDGTNVSGKVSNSGNHALDDVYVYFNGRTASLGPLAPGASRSVPALQDGFFDSNINSAQEAGRAQLMQSLADPGSFTSAGPTRMSDDVIIFGWQQQDGSAVRVLNAGASGKSERLVVLRVPYNLQSGAVQLNLPAVPVSSSDPGSTMAFQVPTGVAVQGMRVDFDPNRGSDPGGMIPQAPPAVGTAIVAGGAMAIPTPAMSSGPVSAGPMQGFVQKLEILDPASQEWVDITDAVQHGDIPGATRYIESSGKVTLRATPQQDTPMEPTYFRLIVTGRKG